MTAPMYTLLILTLILANLPFLTTRAFGVITLKNKGFLHHLLEWSLGFVVMAGVAYILEKRSGMVHAQDWEFYAVVLCLYVVFAFPAFVWRYFWQGRNKE